jgi:predicted Ser/Thr protein kinase
MAKEFSIPGVGDAVAGRYQIDEQIGQGGFGVVFRATQIGMQRTVAIKTLLPGAMTRDDLVERFRREAMLARNLNHPNTIRLYDFGQTEGGLLYIAMEFLDGRTLGQVLRQDGPLEPARVQRITSQILKSLAEAHQHGIIHRDLKPANVMLQDLVGEPDFVKVLDFGIAKALDSRDEADSKLTKTGMGFGTAIYMAPEQIRGKGICAATDLYALGLVMVEMLTGQLVFDGDSAMDIALKQISEEPAPIPDWVLRGPLGPIIQRATQKKAALRYPSAVEMLRDLRAIDPRASIDVSAQIATIRMDAIKHGTPNPFAPPPPAPPAGGKAGLIAASLAALAVLLIAGGVGGYALWQALKAPDAPPVEPDAGLARRPDPPPDPPPAAEVKASIVTMPEGAEILNKDEYMGTTPASIKLPRDVGFVTLLLKLEGFQSTPLEVRLDRDGSYRVELEVSGPKPDTDAGSPPEVAPPEAVAKKEPALDKTSPPRVEPPLEVKQDPPRDPTPKAPEEKKPVAPEEKKPKEPEDKKPRVPEEKKPKVPEEKKPKEPDKILIPRLD